MAEKPDQEEYKLVSKFSQLELGEDLEISLEMLTWNTNCSKGETSTSALRDVLIPIVQKPLEDSNCITFLQEIKIGPEACDTKVEVSQCGNVVYRIWNQRGWLINISK